VPAASRGSPRNGRLGRGLRRREKIATPGARKAVPAAADEASDNAAPASPAAHRPGNAYGHGCGHAIDRTILPWNLIEELRQQLPGTELVTAIPELRHWRGRN